MKGYWNLPDETAHTHRRRRSGCCTGDAAEPRCRGIRLPARPDQGHDHFGRREHLPRRDRERDAMSHPAPSWMSPSSESRLVKWGETPKAFVVKAAGSTVDVQDLVDYCRERLAGFKCPSSIAWIEELPRNPSGKILKRELRRVPYEDDARRT